MNFLVRLADLSPARCLIGSAIIGALYFAIGYDSGSALKLQINDQKAKITKAEEEKAVVERQMKEILLLKAAQEKDAERLAALMSFIPEKLTKTDMMRTLSNEAKAVGVNINQIRDTNLGAGGRGKKSESLEFYEEIGVDVDLVGSFSQLVLFLANLTRLNQILSVKDLALSQTSGVSKDDLAMSAEIIGYRYLGAEAVAKIEAERKAKSSGAKGAGGKK